MEPTASKAVQVYGEAIAAIEEALANQKERAANNGPFDGRVAREGGPLLATMKLFLEGRDPERTGMEIIRVSQSLRRFQEGTYTSFLSMPKYIRQKYYLNGLAAMMIVGGESLGRGLPNKTA